MSENTFHGPDRNSYIDILERVGDGVQVQYAEPSARQRREHVRSHADDRSKPAKPPRKPRFGKR